MSSTESKGRGAHTPGPWFFVEAADNSWTVQTRESGVGHCIAQKYGDSSEANARLIAAAPDLLAALEELLKIRSGRTVSAARAAIARATSEAV